jgi:hypothetical protein
LIKARGILNEQLHSIILRESEVSEGFHDDIDAYSAQNNSGVVLLKVHRHGHSHHLAEPKGIFVGLCPDRFLDADTSSNVRVVVLHDSCQFRLCSDGLDFKHDAIELTGHLLQNIGISFSQGVGEQDDVLDVIFFHLVMNKLNYL